MADDPREQRRSPACTSSSPTIHGDERGFFVETYRREWFPQGREMIQGNRGDRQAGCHRRAALPPAPGRLLVRAVRPAPASCCTTCATGSPTDGATLAVDLGAPRRRHPRPPRRVHPARRRARLRRAHRHDDHLPRRRLLQPGRRARRRVGRPGDRRPTGASTEPDPLATATSNNPAPCRHRPALAARTGRCAPEAAHAHLRHRRRRLHRLELRPARARAHRRRGHRVRRAHLRRQPRRRCATSTTTRATSS